MTNDYDEDVSQNPFFKTFLHNYLDLFSQCVQEKWLICVPRMDSLPKYTFTLEDFTHHILRPLKICQELTSCPSNILDIKSTTSSPSSLPSLSRDSSYSNLSSHAADVLASSTSSNYNPSHPHIQPKWNYRTLAEINIEYSEKTLFLDTTADMPIDLFSEDLPHHRHQTNNNPRSVSVLFDETFYTVDKRKYKVLCISSPLNSQMELQHWEEDRNPGMWNLTSLRDCIDFLWINGRPRTLETFDAYIKLFLHNHRSLEDLPLPVQRDLVHDLYNRCITNALRLDKVHKGGGALKNGGGGSHKSTRQQYSSLETVHSSSGTSSVSSGGTRSNHSVQNFRLATETYVLNGIYLQLIAALSSAVSFEDSTVNKVMRNVADIHPQDLGINNIHWENLSRARQELARLPMHPTPLGKLKCLRTTMKHLQQCEKSFEQFDENEGIISTDELLPIWVFLIIKTNIGNWMAQLQFLRQFRFSALETPDNESSFFIVTLEASLLFLKSGKISGGLAESERDVGTPYQDYVGEFWLRCLFNNSSDDESLLGEMFGAIRQGNKDKLEQLISDYDTERIKEDEGDEGLDGFNLCHPLCNCSKCASYQRPQIQTKIDTVYQLRNEDCGVTLLHVACIYGRPKIVDFLLASGSPFDIPDTQGRLPVHYAASRGHQNALLLLLHAGCPIDASDHSQNTVLHLASLNGHESCVKALIYYAEHSKQNLDVSSRNCNGDTSLHFASRYGFLGIVQLLVESGASIAVLNARQRNPLDVAHDNHVTRILQRSLCRRSLVQRSHGDFVNVDMVPKGTTEGVLMLISDPMPDSCASSVIENEVKEAMSDEAGVSRSRRSSNTSQPSNSGTVTRKTSSVVTPSFTPTIREGEIEEILNGTVEERPSSRKKRSLQTDESKDADAQEIGREADEMIFHISNTVPEIQPSPEHLHKVSVYNLEHAPHVLAAMAHVGVRRRREYQARELRKLFLAIENGDSPLALFYLGIPTEELESVDSIIPGSDAGMDKCHPLCPCMKCTAKSAGILFKLGLDLNVVTPNGFTVLHLAVIYNNHPLVKILLKYGIDSSIRSTNGGKTALQYAKERYFEDIAVTLQLWTNKGQSSPSNDQNYTSQVSSN